MKNLAYLFTWLFITATTDANATVLDFSSLGSGNLGVSSVSLPGATVTNLSGNPLYVGAAGIGSEICALSSGFNCQADLKIDFNTLASDLSFVVSGWNPGDNVLASIFDSSNTVISSLSILTNGFYDFGTTSGISKIIFNDSSTGAGFAYDAVTFNQTSSVPVPGASSVPVPGAAWLFGSGLIGLIRMRKKAAKMPIL